MIIYRTIIIYYTSWFNRVIYRVLSLVLRCWRRNFRNI